MAYKTHGVSEKQIKMSYWWLSNSDKFKLFGLTILTTIIGLWWLYIIYSLLAGLFNFSKELSTTSLLAIQPKVSIKKISAPKPINFGPAVVLASRQGVYDFIVPVTNQNSSWLVSSLKYFFVYNNQATTSIKKIIINPNSSNYLTFTGVKSDVLPYDLSYDVVEQSWQRFQASDVLPDDFSVSVKSIDLDSDGVAQRVDASVRNNSLANYWEINWLAVAYSGYQPVAVQDVTTEKFTALTTKTIYFNWFNRLPRIDRVEIIPQFDRFDKTLIYKTEAKPQKY